MGDLKINDGDNPDTLDPSGTTEEMVWRASKGMATRNRLREQEKRVVLMRS